MFESGLTIKKGRGPFSWSVILMSALCIVLIGWFRERYILNFFLSEAPFLIGRSAPNLQSYPMNMEGLLQQFVRDPRWFTTLLLNSSMMLFSALIVGLWFGKKAYFWLVIAAYAFLSMLCGGLVGLSLLLKSYELGYGVAQQLKNLLQLPFLLILFIPILTLSEKGSKEV
ncbi:hypothetical protein [Nafulsella turpanensis]|uniref:hypothetical protein n=1 Tax=Nafulsella turpanensis TaxID=1265690 RepID=UPI000348F2BD|nr:hypothetical protein [Nafulsella turpanensis]